MPSDEYFEIAARAAKRLVEERGEDATFPFDAVWCYTDAGEVVPSTSRPHQAARLVKSGHLELTGGMTQAGNA